MGKMEIDYDNMRMDKPEYMASMFINLCEEELSTMNEFEFALWLDGSWSREEIILGGNKLKAPENKKKAILHFIAFWYYRSKEPS